MEETGRDITTASGKAAAIEAILFVAGEAVTYPQLQEALEASPKEITEAVLLLRDMYSGCRGIRLIEFSDKLQLGTQIEYAPYIEKVLQPVQRQSLTRAATETLAIIAYRQPTTRLEIEAIRGVKCDYAISSLLRKRLIQDVGRKETLGRPVLYATTDEFLRHFGLSSLAELPPLEDFGKD